MKTVDELICLPEGKFKVPITFFDKSDDKLLKEIYSQWRSLSQKLKKIGGGAINLPEGLSEPAFCRAMNMVRFTESITSANTSFDAYDLKNNRRVQIKACSVLPDLTSFGPKSQWDDLYFVDFYNEGNWDGTIKIYLIPNEFIFSHKVNSNETFRQQQSQGRRPRFSIYSEIIQQHKIKPIMTYKI